MMFTYFEIQQYLKHMGSLFEVLSLVAYNNVIYSLETTTDVD